MMMPSDPRKNIGGKLSRVYWGKCGVTKKYMISEMIDKCGISDKEDHKERLMVWTCEEKGRRECQMH